MRDRRSKFAAPGRYLSLLVAIFADLIRVYLIRVYLIRVYLIRVYLIRSNQQ